MTAKALNEYSAVIASPLPGEWRLGFRYQNGVLAEIDFLPASTPLIGALPEAVQAVSQMRQYFENSRAGFRLQLMPAGTSYQQQVWAALMGIPAGDRQRYGALAQQLSSGARAVAAACRANPIPIVIPCHRVVAAKGMGGYMGALEGPELAIKQWLLEHESGA